MCYITVTLQPKCLVLVPTWKKAQEVVDLANEMLQGKTTLTCLAIYAGRCEENQVVSPKICIWWGAIKINNLLNTNSIVSE